MPEAAEGAAAERGPFEQLLATFAEAAPARMTSAFFRDLCQAHTEITVTHACLKYLARAEEAPGQRPAADWLGTSGAYLAALLDPGVLSLSEARRAAAFCRRYDPKFFSRLQRILAEGQAPVPLILHALSVVGELDDTGTLLPLLRVLNRHHDEHVRSAAAKTLCKLRPNRPLVERQLHSLDARTRANAIEGLWGLKTKETEEIFRAAAADAHHRVAVNALVGLYYQGDPTALDRLIECSRHRSTLHRAAAVWAFGKLEDARAIPALEACCGDSRTMVRRKAAEVLAALRAKATPSEPTAPDAPEVPSAA